MTTIIGIQGDHYAVIGVDSRVSEAPDHGVTTQILTLTESNSKVALNGRYLIGAAGDVRAINILHHAFKPPECPPNLKGKKLDHFFTIKFIPALMECFDLHKYSQPQNETSLHLSEQGSSIIVSINNTLYVIDGDYSWASDLSAIYAIGSGAEYALGAAYTMIGKSNPNLGGARKIAMKALAAAGKFDPGTGPPYHIYSQGKGLDRPLVSKNAVRKTLSKKSKTSAKKDS